MLSKEYTTLFNAITDAINLLVAAQQKAEEIIMSRPAPQILLLEAEREESEQMQKDYD